MLYLGLAGGYYHDAAACLFEDGRLVAFIEEERLTGRRYAENTLPNRCIEACLDAKGVRLGDIDVVALSWNPNYPIPRDRLERGHPALGQLLPEERFGPWSARVEVIDHQLSHAAAAYRTSGIDDAIVISADGSGDGRSLAVYRARGGRLDEIESLDITQSLGWFYQRVTTFLGIGHWQNAGKTMALAALGEQCFDFPFLAITPGEGFRFDYPADVLPPADEPLRAETRSRFYARQKEFLHSWLRTLAGDDWEAPRRRFRYDTGEQIYETPTPVACDLAASAQRAVEDALIALVSRHLRAHAPAGLCLGGGVMHNCKAVGRIARLLPDDCRLYVSPVSGDSGGAVGAALEAMWRIEGVGSFPFTHAYWGPGYDDAEVEAILRRLGTTFDIVDDPAAAAAEFVAAGRCVGWFQGRMEVGARALGGRSILARPDSPELSGHINREVKNRETWRPFSPSVASAGIIDRYWHAGHHASPFMAVALDLRQTTGATAGVSHVDGTSRVQLLRAEDNPRYARVITEVGHATGVPMVLNTSFNGRDQPIVCTPVDALRTFHTTALDTALLGRCLLRKHDI